MLGQLVITDAELDGVKVAVIVGTGAQGSVGNLALQEKLRGRELRRRDDDRHQRRHAIEQSEARPHRSRSAGSSVSNIPIAFVDSPTFEALGLDDKPAMVLGMSELRLFKRVAIDFKERKVLFDLPPNAQWYASFRRACPSDARGRAAPAIALLPVKPQVHGRCRRTPHPRLRLTASPPTGARSGASCPICGSANAPGVRWRLDRAHCC